MLIGNLAKPWKCKCELWVCEQNWGSWNVLKCYEHHWYGVYETRLVIFLGGNGNTK